MKEKLFLLLTGLGFAGVGVVNLILPKLGIALFEIELSSASALSEIRANYGGMHALFGMFLIIGAFKIHVQRIALLIVAVFTGGLVLGRLTSLLMDGSPNAGIWLLLSAEAVLCLAASVLYVSHPVRVGIND